MWKISRLRIGKDMDGPIHGQINCVIQAFAGRDRIHAQKYQRGSCCHRDSKLTPPEHTTEHYRLTNLFGY